MLRMTLAAVVLAASLASAPARAEDAPLYLFLYRPGPAWQVGKPMHQQALKPHTVYIQKLLDEGKLVAGGPTLDVDGGMAIVRAASAEEARAMLAVDPAITGGVFVAEVRTWRPVYASPRPLKP
ncbi:MAG: YciI family protein [Phenylobacterium sp.]